MRRLLPLGTALAVTAAIMSIPVNAPATPGAADSTTAVEKRARLTPTAFGMRAQGFGSEIRGGQVPAASGTTAFQSLGCTNMAGIRRSNYEAEVAVPGLGRISGVRTGISTVRTKDGEVASISRHSIARLVLAESSFGRLEIAGINSWAKAFHKGRFGTDSGTEVARIVYRSPDGETQELALPTPGDPLTIPGLLRIAVGFKRNMATSEGARAAANGLDIKLLPTDSRVRIAHAHASISRVMVSGIFRGYSNTTRASVANGVVRSGPTLLSLMPCRGTKGIVQVKEAAGVNLGGQLVVGAVRSRQMGRQNARVSTGFEEASVAHVNLGDGQLEINAIQGRVTVTRARGGKPKVDFSGTTVGEIIADGEPQQLPESGVLEIPGVAKIETNVQTRSANGGKVIAVRLTLLDGSGAVVNIGEALLHIAPTKL